MAKKRTAEEKEPKKEEKEPKKEEKTKPEKPKKEKKNKPQQTLAEQEQAIHNLLDAFTKDQLIDLLTDAALNSPPLFQSITQTADKDVSHRKVFVHGFGWDTTRELLFAEFQKYGEIEDCHVVVDKLTGRAKGFGFVIFKDRLGAAKALKQPQKKIKSRIASCQLAAIGPPSTPTLGRKIYVSNVPMNTKPDNLKSFFAAFGEIEEGPQGFDSVTGLSRGYAIFVYKTLEGAKKVLEEPNKVFEGNHLHCKRALEGDGKMRVLQPGQRQVSNFGSSELALLGLNQNAGFNPGISSLMANPGAPSSLMANPGAPSSLTAYPGLNHGAGSMNPGSFASIAAGYGYGGAQYGLGNSAIGGSQAAALPGLQSFSQLGQSSARSTGTGNSIGGFSSYLY